MNEGWICPKCGNVYAPVMMECNKCNVTRHQNQDKDLIKNIDRLKEKCNYYTTSWNEITFTKDKEDPRYFTFSSSNRG